MKDMREMKEFVTHIEEGMKVTYQFAKRKKNNIVVFELNDRLTKFIEKQNIEVLFDKFYKLIDKVSKL